MQIEIVSTFTRFGELRDDWNRLAGDLPLRSWEWAYSWAETMLGSGRLMILIGANDVGEIVGIAPFYLQHHWLRGDVIRMLGDGDCCTDYTTVLTQSSHSDQFIDALVDWLANRPAGHTLSELESIALADDTGDAGGEWLGWDLIKWEGVGQQDAVMQRLLTGLAMRDCLCKLRTLYGTWSVDVPKSWDQYVQGLSKSQRRNVRRVQQRVLDADGVCVRHVHDLESLSFALQWLRQLHQKRWTRDGQPGCFANEHFASFVDCVAARLFDAGMLRMLWIEKDGNPIAVDFSMLSGDASFGYQMGVDPDYRDQELGRALMVAAMQATVESGRRTFDFLRGDEAYKTRWMAQCNPLLDIEIVPDRSLPQLRQNLTDLGRSVKSKFS